MTSPARGAVADKRTVLASTAALRDHLTSALCPKPSDLGNLARGQHVWKFSEAGSAAVYRGTGVQRPRTELGNLGSTRKRGLGTKDTSTDPTGQVSMLGKGTVAVAGGKGGGASTLLGEVGPLSSFGRGPFQTAGIHDFIAVGPFGLFGYPLVDKILKQGGKEGAS